MCPKSVALRQITETNKQKDAKPHEQRDESSSVRRIDHSRLLGDVEVDDLLFEVFVLQELLKILPERTHTHTKQKDMRQDLFAGQTLELWVMETP